MRTIIVFLLLVGNLAGTLHARAQFRADAKTTVSPDSDAGQTRLFLDEARTPAPIGTVLWFVADRLGDGVPRNPVPGAILGPDDVLLHVDRVDGSLAGNQLGRFNRSGILVSDSALAAAAIHVYLWNSAAPGEFVPRAGDRFDVLNLGVKTPPQVGNALWYVAADMVANRLVVGGEAADEPPSILEEPQDLSLPVGGTGSFTVRATGVPAPVYQWRFNGTNLTGATLAALTLTGVQLDDAGEYSVVVSNRAGVVTSRNARLTVLPPDVPPGILSQPVSLTVTVGAQAVFEVVAQGTPPLQYQWMKNGINLDGATNELYLIASASPGDAGTYTVRVRNMAGMVDSDPALLTVNPLSTPIILSVTRSGTNLLLTWTGGQPEFVLERRLSFSDGQWLPLLRTSNRLAEVPMDDTAGYYRVGGN